MQIRVGEGFAGTVAAPRRSELVFRRTSSPDDQESVTSRGRSQRCRSALLEDGVVNRVAHMGLKSANEFSCKISGCFWR